jgi:hypothetical protein
MASDSSTSGSSSAVADAKQKLADARKAQADADAAKAAAAGPAKAAATAEEAATVAKRHTEVIQAHADAAQRELTAAQAEKAAADAETEAAYKAYQKAPPPRPGYYAPSPELEKLKAAQAAQAKANEKVDAARAKTQDPKLLKELGEAKEAQEKADKAAEAAKAAAEPSGKAAEEAQAKADKAKAAAESAEEIVAFSDHETKLGAAEGVDLGAGHVDVVLMDEEIKFIPGKYFLISVPEFARDPLDAKNMMTSYIRLGASSPKKEAYWDKFLEDKIRESNPPGGHLTPVRTPVDGTAEDPRPLFVDDNRVRKIPGEAGGAALPPDTEGKLTTPDSEAAELYAEPNAAPAAANGHQLSFAERKEYSDWLHGRGGWRDHSDGNRITTTWGDKVEVIRGNYRMLVLGRQDDATLASGWDASGNHIQDFAPGTMPGASVRVEYTEKYDGSWHLQNTTEGVVQSSNFAGDFYEYHWGNHQESITGTESEAAMEKDYKEDNGGVLVPRSNPVIIEKTWAKSMYSQVGSEKCEVESVVEKQWAKEVKSYEGSAGHRAELKYEEVWADKIEEHTHAGSTSGTTNVDGSISETTTAGSITESTTAGTILGKTMAGAITEMTLAGAQTELALVGNHLEMFAGLSEEIKLGAAFELFAGAKLEVNIGPRVTFSTSEEHEITPETVKAHVNKMVVAAVMHFLGPVIMFGI